MSSIAIKPHQKDMPSETEQKGKKLAHTRVEYGYELRKSGWILLRFYFDLTSACLKTRPNGELNRVLCISEWEVPVDQSRISSQSGCGQSRQACIGHCVRRLGTG